MDYLSALLFLGVPLSPGSWGKAPSTFPDWYINKATGLASAPALGAGLRDLQSPMQTSSGYEFQSIGGVWQLCARLKMGCWTTGFLQSCFLVWETRNWSKRTFATSLEIKGLEQTRQEWSALFHSHKRDFLQFHSFWKPVMNVDLLSVAFPRTDFVLVEHPLSV